MKNKIMSDVFIDSHFFRRQNGGNAENRHPAKNTESVEMITAIVLNAYLIVESERTE